VWHLDAQIVFALANPAGCALNPPFFRGHFDEIAPSKTNPARRCGVWMHGEAKKLVPAVPGVGFGCNVWDLDAADLCVRSGWADCPIPSPHSEDLPLFVFDCLFESGHRKLECLCRFPAFRLGESVETVDCRLGRFHTQSGVPARSANRLPGTGAVWQSCGLGHLSRYTRGWRGARQPSWPKAPTK
jgi:hypothetical protein